MESCAFAIDHNGVERNLVCQLLMGKVASGFLPNGNIVKPSFQPFSKPIFLASDKELPVHAHFVVHELMNAHFRFALQYGPSEAFLLYPHIRGVSGQMHILLLDKNRRVQDERRLPIKLFHEKGLQF